MSTFVAGILCAFLGMSFAGELGGLVGLSLPYAILLERIYFMLKENRKHFKDVEDTK